MNYSPVVDFSESNSIGDGGPTFFDVSSASTEIMMDKNEIKTKISNIIDCCSYSIENLFLIKDSHIICEHIDKKTIRKISNNRILTNIIYFSGNVYGKDKKGQLYILSTKHYESFYWIWEPVDWVPKNIQHLSVTLDQKYLFIQTFDKSYLFNDKHSKPEIIKTNHRRIYGKNKNTYLEIDNHDHCHIIIDDVNIKTIRNIISGVIDCYDNINLLSRSDLDKYCDIKILNHKYYYIEKD